MDKYDKPRAGIGSAGFQPANRSAAIGKAGLETCGPKEIRFWKSNGLDV